MSETKTLRFDDLTDYLLLKNGNFLYKIPLDDAQTEWGVLKVYEGSRNTWQRFQKSFANVVLLGQTSYWPATRLKVERDCVKLWQSHGFRTFKLYEDIEVIAPPSQCPADKYLIFGYVEAPLLEDVLFDHSRDEDERFEVYKRFLEEWCRRHDIAEREKDPRLQHENGDFGHVMVMDDGEGEFLWFDLEMVYRDPSKVTIHLWHEIIQYLWYVLRKAPPQIQQRLLDDLIRFYPNRERLAEAHRVFIDHPHALMRWGRAIDAKRKRQQKPTSKINVARRLRDRIAEIG